MLLICRAYWETCATGFL